MCDQFSVSVVRGRALRTVSSLLASLELVYEKASFFIRHDLSVVDEREPVEHCTFIELLGVKERVFTFLFPLGE